MRRLIAATLLVVISAACASSSPVAASSHRSSPPAASPTRPSTAARPTVSPALAKPKPAVRRVSAAVRHVFVIVLENESYDDTYLHNPNPYLGKKLQQQGTLLTHYFGTGHASLDNYIAMISGQAPNPATSADCPNYNDFQGTMTDQNGQAIGTGCVYPSNIRTLADQLSHAHITWGGYMDQMGRTPSREQKRCGIPTLTSAGHDDTQGATTADQYAARHNPFVYFHSLIDSGRCARHVVRLGRLRTALHRVRTTPRFAFITPNLCNDGHDKPCVGKDARGSNAGGLVSVDHFLRTWIPRIKHSPAYRKNGLIIVTSDESATSDTASCCNEQPGPTDPFPGITGPGGGRVGTLVLGHCVRRGARDPRHYNHYSLLRSLENLYGIRAGGTDGHGHLGYAAQAGLRPFGHDLFTRCR